MSSQDDPNKPFGEDRPGDGQPAGERDWPEPPTDLPFSNPHRGGLEESYNQEIHGDERGGQVPKRP